jgi:hypothetical protein
MYRRRISVVLLGSALIAAGTVIALAQTDPRACEQEFIKLRTEVDKRGAAIKAANNRKAPLPEACQLFRNFTAAEVRIIKFLVEKQFDCQIPDEIVKQAKQGHAQATAFRDKVCKVAAEGGPPPPPPPSLGLSGALGSSNVGAAPAESPGGSGVFDTITGNVLQR